MVLLHGTSHRYLFSSYSWHCRCISYLSDLFYQCLETLEIVLHLFHCPYCRSYVRTGEIKWIDKYSVKFEGISYMDIKVYIWEPRKYHLTGCQCRPCKCADD